MACTFFVIDDEHGDYAQLLSQLSSGMQERADWEGTATHPATFERLIPGDYTICAVPLAWSPSDHNQMQRVYSAPAAVNVYCTPVRVAPAPEQQTLTVEVPAMSSLP